MPYSDPNLQRAAQREHARRKRAASADGDINSRTDHGDVEPVAALVPAAMQIEKADDVLDVLNRQIRAIESSQTADALMKARAVAQIAGPMLRAIEARDAALIRDIDGHLAILEGDHDHPNDRAARRRNVVRPRRRGEREQREEKGKEPGHRTSAKGLCAALVRSRPKPRKRG